tara:strand:+ start:311 stop:583 length:273 start_codon:yes stop_codon:yes gene_type:complete
MKKKLNKFDYKLKKLLKLESKIIPAINKLKKMDERFDPYGYFLQEQYISELDNKAYELKKYIYKFLNGGELTKEEYFKKYRRINQYYGES